MKLLNGFILIRVDDEVTKTDSGLLLQSGAVRLPQSGVVEKIADDIDPSYLGKRVVFLRYAALDGTEEGTRLCKMEHLVGVIDG